VKRTNFASLNGKDVPGPGTYIDQADDSQFSNLRKNRSPNFSVAQERDTGAFALRDMKSPFQNNTNITSPNPG
jgi:hypothetical protein